MPDPAFGDCVGVESSADLESDVDAALAPPRRHKRPAAAEKKEFPPPISWLARTESLPSHMPRVMRKYCTTDGRLIIKEERVRCHDYFLADRSDGRLVLNLIHVDDDDSVVEDAAAVEEIRSTEIGGGEEGIKRDLTVEEVAAECYKYNSLGLKPCGGFVATVPVFRPPVHT
ncbi:uncharacterized protein LOC131012008 [Salvia miltiorrhiza]|uniref:uncharacterized protein LOC131012008 n=1 Tax=Salvia miltiorrhiza TaxID=226208 RepID=UPI0025ACE721|nr:uncharacterized protein LOC131012008 [Salvia miltiorrhiza]